MKVRFHPLAERELVAAALYLNQEAGLGSDFLDEYADCYLYFCREAIAGNAKAVGQYKDGNEKALRWLKGPVMKATKGKANPAMLDQLLKKLIDEG